MARVRNRKRRGSAIELNACCAGKIGAGQCDASSHLPARRGNRRNRRRCHAYREIAGRRRRPLRRHNRNLSRHCRARDRRRHACRAHRRKCRRGNSANRNRSRTVQICPCYRNGSPHCAARRAEARNGGSLCWLRRCRAYSAATASCGQHGKRQQNGADRNFVSPRTKLARFALASALPKQHGAHPFAQASAGAERIAKLHTVLRCAARYRTLPRRIALRSTGKHLHQGTVFVQRIMSGKLVASHARHSHTAQLTLRSSSIYRWIYITAAAPNIMPEKISATTPATNHLEIRDDSRSTPSAVTRAATHAALSLKPPLISRRDATLGTPAATLPTKL